MSSDDFPVPSNGEILIKYMDEVIGTGPAARHLHEMEQNNKQNRHYAPPEELVLAAQMERAYQANMYMEAIGKGQKPGDGAIPQKSLKRDIIALYSHHHVRITHGAKTAAQIFERNVEEPARAFLTEHCPEISGVVSSRGG